MKDGLASQSHSSRQPPQIPPRAREGNGMGVARNSSTLVGKTSCTNMGPRYMRTAGPTARSAQKVHTTCISTQKVAACITRMQDNHGRCGLAKASSTYTVKDTTQKRVQRWPLVGTQHIPYNIQQRLHTTHHTQHKTQNRYRTHNTQQTPRTLQHPHNTPHTTHNYTATQPHNNARNQQDNHTMIQQNNHTTAQQDDNRAQYNNTHIYQKT